MRIEAVNTRLARLPIQGVPWGDTFHHVTHIEYCITEVKTDTGLTGVGFSHTSGVGGSTIKHLIDVELGPYLLGSPAAPRPVWHRGWNFLRDLGGGQPLGKGHLELKRRSGSVAEVVGGADVVVVGAVAATAVVRAGTPTARAAAVRATNVAATPLRPPMGAD